MAIKIMKPESVAALADFITETMNARTWTFSRNAMPYLTEALSDCVVDGRYDEAKIYDALYALNIAAYIAAYRPDYDGEINGFKAYEPNTQSFNAGWELRMLKLLDCFLDNCGPVDDEALCFALTMLHSFLIAAAIKAQPEFRNADVSIMKPESVAALADFIATIPVGEYKAFGDCTVYDAAKVYDALYVMNEVETFPAYEPNPQTFNAGWQWRMMKLIDNILDNCEMTDTGLGMALLYNDIADYIVQAQPEYQIAKWE